MSLTRAFTTRRVKQSLQTSDMDSMPHRSNTTKGFGSIRSKISGPVQLVHTTNMLSYNAPDLFPKSASSTASSKSDDDLSDSALTNNSSPPTSPDVPSPPKQASTVEPNHLSCYFSPPGQSTVAAKTVEAPAIPQRAPSHTKKSYDSLSRQRSTSRLSEQSHRTVSTKTSFSFSRASSSSTSTTATHNSTTPPPSHMAKLSGASASAPAPVLAPVVSKSSPVPLQPAVQHKKDFSPAQHPFGPELAQVSEIAEEYGVKERLNMIDREEHDLVAKGLFKFSAEEYLNEIQGLFSSIFVDARPAVAAVAATATSAWI